MASSSPADPAPMPSESMQAAPASVLPPDHSELPPGPPSAEAPAPPTQQAPAPTQQAPTQAAQAEPAAPAAAVAAGFSLFSPGGIILLLLLASCGGGVIWLGARLKELDERMSRLKEMVSRLDDDHESLSKRITAGPQAEREPVRRERTTGQIAATGDAAQLERAVQAALADTVARLERTDGRTERLARDLADVLGPALDDIKRKMETLERRSADTARNPFSSSHRVMPESPSGDPLSALAASLSRAHARLAPRSGGAASADPAAVKMADALAEVETSLSGIEQVSAGPLASDLSDLTGRLRTFVRGVRHRAGLGAGLGGGEQGAAPMTLEEFVQTYGDQLPADARTRPVVLFSTYLEHVSRSAAKAGSGGGGGPALSEQDALAQVFTYVDTLHNLRDKASDWDRQSGGSEHLSMTLDRLFEGFRSFLRAYNLSVVAPERGQVPDTSTSRIAKSMPDRNVPSNTVLRTLSCGFKDTMTGRVVRMAEVVTAS